MLPDALSVCLPSSMHSTRVYFNNIGYICTDSLRHGNGLSALLLLTRAAKSSAAKSSAAKTRSMESRLNACFQIKAFEMWCYRRMLRIGWTSHTTNIDVLQKIGVKETTMLNTLKNIKFSYAGHIMRNTSGHYDTLLTIIEGRREGK